MTTDHHDPSPGLLVVGSGPAGVHAAAAYVAAGGPGPVRLLSADRHDPYERPPLSKSVLAGEEPPEVSPILEDELALALVEVRFGTRVARLDLERRLVQTEDGEELGYDQLVLATGSTPQPLPGVAEGARVHVLRSLDHGRDLVAAVAGATRGVVVGSGFIGCEAAASLARRGVRTTLVTPEPAPQAARLGEWAGARLAEWLEAAGVELRTGVEVESVTAETDVRLGDGSIVRADVVLAAVGVTQAQDFVDASGLSTDGGRVLADESLRSSDPRVWVAGDVALAHHAVADRPVVVEHWGDAITMGQLAGRNAAAAASPSPRELQRWDFPPGFWSEIGEHVLKYAAWGDGFERAEVVERDGGGFTVWYADGTGELVGVLTHESDDDYERGGELLARRARLTDALG